MSWLICCLLVGAQKTWHGEMLHLSVLPDGYKNDHNFIMLLGFAYLDLFIDENVQYFKIISEFRILRLTFQRKSASKS